MHLTSPSRAHAPCHAAKKQLQNTAYTQTFPCRQGLQICTAVETLLRQMGMQMFIFNTATKQSAGQQEWRTAKRSSRIFHKVFHNNGQTGKIRLPY